MREIIDRLTGLVVDLLPRYARELKTDLLIAIGCTGGRHRSVFIADRLATSGATVKAATAASRSRGTVRRARIPP